MSLLPLDVPERSKRCTKCRERKPVDAFKPKEPDQCGRPRWESWCRPCVNAYRRGRYVSEGEYERMIQRHRLRAYGLTPEAYAELMTSQGWACAICRVDLTRAGRGAHVDHDHATGAVRGVLCARCNTRLVPLAERTPDALSLLTRALEYLTRHVSRADVAS